MKSALADRVQAWREGLSHPVVAVGLGMIAIQLIFRGWATFNGWFYVDDFIFMTDATGRDLSWDYLLTRHDFQFMPGGRLAAWIVAHAGPFNWSAAAAVLMVFQLLASCLCLAMLCRLFGKRWWCLAPLGFYLFSSMTVTAFMWWAAAINQLPCQAAFFGAMLLHSNYMSTRRTRFAVAAALTVALGLCFYVKASLILGVLVLFTLLYGTVGANPIRRVGRLITQYWAAWLVYAPLGLAYAVYYLTHVPNPLSSESIQYLDLLKSMIGVSLGTTLVGGPWKWANPNPPAAVVAAPDWVAWGCWVGIAVWCVFMLRTRRGDWRALAIAIPYLAVSYLLVAQGRGLFGGYAGLELRYLADSAPVLALCIGLFAMRLTLPLNGDAPQPAAPALRPLPLVPTAAILLAMLLSGAFSSLQYARHWTGPFPAKSFTQVVQSDSARSALTVVDAPVPSLVMPSLSFPFNLPSRLFFPLGDDVVGLTSGTDLSILDSSGRPWPAVVSGGAVSEPGPIDDCGHAIGSTPTSIDFSGAPQEFVWWMEISYLAGDGVIEVAVADRREEFEVRKGLHRLVLQGEGSIEEVSVRTVTHGLGLCIDTVNVGNVSPLEPVQ